MNRIRKEGDVLDEDPTAANLAYGLGDLRIVIRGRRWVACTSESVECHHHWNRISH
ncbi:hypothetical protein QHF83_05510 [Polyangium sp. 15x6]|nr:hypothetical protein [Polyangium sp. 15x6]